MSEFRIPDEWRNEFIKAYIPLIADINSGGVYKHKIEALSTEEVYKVIYFCEVSSRKEWLEGMTKFDKQHKDLALRYINFRGSLVPRLAIPFSVKLKKYRDDLFNIIKILSLFLVSLFLIGKYLWINPIIYVILIISILILVLIYIGSKNRINIIKPLRK